jgi:hypothetical protein
MNSEDFTSGFWELVVFRYLKTTGHDIFYHEEADGKTPDFYWPKEKLCMNEKPSQSLNNSPYAARNLTKNRDESNNSVIPKPG